MGVEISYTLTIFETEEVYPRHPLLSLLDMLNLVYTHHLKGEAVSEQALRNVLGRKELPKWYTYINYLQDSNLITMTEDDDYVLKRDLSKMTLWDFYRTLPYPLPIKDEFDEMTTEDQKPWLSLLVARFENTESYAKQQLNLPLSTIFADSEPRKKADSDEENALKGHKNNLFRKTNNKIPPVSSDSKSPSNLEKSPHFDPATYDKESDVEYDEHNNEILIPMDANEVHDTHHSETDTTRRDNHKRSIITEADNPQPYQ